MDIDIQGEVRTVYRTFTICKGIDEGIITVNVVKETDSSTNNVEIFSLTKELPFEVCNGIEVLKKEDGMLIVHFLQNIKQQNTIKYINILIGSSIQNPIFVHKFLPSLL